MHARELCQQLMADVIGPGELLLRARRDFESAWEWRVREKTTDRLPKRVVKCRAGCWGRVPRR
eukprot:2143615-Lingulodinium_polyedra.AAC.1